MKFKKVTRVELIIGANRQFVTWCAKDVMIDLQDNERTLKIFLNKER